MAAWIFLEIFYASYLDELHDQVISSLLMTFQWYGWNWSNYEIKAQKLMFETKMYHNNSHKIVHVFVAYKPISFATK
jgi:hypothetical protein